MWGSNLFHVGILVIAGGHFVGLLTPSGVPCPRRLAWRPRGYPVIAAGGIAGLMCLVGIALLTHRRLFDSVNPPPRRSAAAPPILLLLFAQLLLGLATIPVSAGHLDGHEMVKFNGLGAGDRDAAAQRRGERA